MPQYVISIDRGHPTGILYFCPKKVGFVDPIYGYRYGTRAMAKKSLNAALAKKPQLADLNPEITVVM